MSKYSRIKETKPCYVNIIFNEIFIGNNSVFPITLRVFTSLSFHFSLETHAIAHVLQSFFKDRNLFLHMPTCNVDL